MAEDPEDSLNVNTPGLDAQWWQDIGVPIPPVAGGENDQRFKSFDMRDAARAVGEGGEGETAETILPDDVPVQQSDTDRDFTPTCDEAFGMPLVKTCIKYPGTDVWKEETGRMYFRQEDSENSSADTCGHSKPCITKVPEWFWESRYTALFCMEAPEVRFEDFNEITLTGRYTYTPLDPRYVAVCEPGTIMVRSVQGAKSGSYGASIDEGEALEIDAGFFWWLKSKKVKVSLTGIRRGFGKNPSKSPFSAIRFPKRTKAQFDKNEEFLKQAVFSEKDD